MRRMSRLMAGIAMLAVLVGGCGSTGGAGGDDALVLQFIQWDTTNITQLDTVTESNAQVNVVPHICDPTMPLQTDTDQPTVINAIFRNNEGSDILLEAYSTQIGDPQLAQADITNGHLSTNITGGRCSNAEKCVTDSDCGLGGTCGHIETTVSDLVLFDKTGKQQIFVLSQHSPSILNRVIPLNVTFFGSDPNRTFQVTAGYQVTFGNFNNCMSSEGMPTATPTPVPTAMPAGSGGGGVS